MGGKTPTAMKGPYVKRLKELKTEKHKLKFMVSEKRACQVTGQPRSTKRSTPRRRERSIDSEITKALFFALTNSRQGYHKANRAILAAYRANFKRVRRIWREAGLKLPYRKRQNKKTG